MSRPHVFAWATANLPFTFEHEDGTPAPEALDGWQQVIVTISQGQATVEKTGADVGVDPENAVVNVRLEQADTGRLKGGRNGEPKQASVQVNVYYGHDRMATYESAIDVYRNLHPKEMR